MYFPLVELGFSILGQKWGQRFTTQSIRGVYFFPLIFELIVLVFPNCLLTGKGGGGGAIHCNICMGYLRWPKRVNHKSVHQNTKHFISQNTNQYYLPKHK